MIFWHDRMEFVNFVLDTTTRLWHCTSRRAHYILNLPENLYSLKLLTQDLINLSQDVLERIHREEQLQQSRRTHQVDGWLRDVHLIQAQVDELLQIGHRDIQNRCLGGTCPTPRNFMSSYRLGKVVSVKIAAVTQLMGHGHFDVVAHRLPFPPVDERPVAKTVGLDLMFQRVRDCLEDRSVRTIGLYGIGGVGKTTLLQKINNDYFGGAINGFHAVIWVVVSKPVSIEKIQKVILKKLGAPDVELTGKGKEEMAADIFKLLKAKKFAILLDDMWERLDLLEVGIPALDHQTESKVVFTARSEQVCYDMEADKGLKVECLTEDEAFSLFCENVGDSLLNSHPDIRRLARVVVEECRGLPLALVVIGRSMASRKTPRAWDQAIQVLKSYPSMLAGMGDQVFSILKFSYDDLDNDTIKSCFLYCSLFPEDHYISSEDIVNLWIGEGLLDEFSDIYKARNQGDEVIRTLKQACLLEGDTSEYECKMHDVIRDMALWLSCDYPRDDGHQKHKSFVLNHVKLVEAYETVKWKEARRIALWGSNFSPQPSLSPSFNNLRTLILRYSNMKSLPDGFFQNMHVIRVLDLEGNTELEELPLEICGLESLEYMNLSSTRMEKLPVELKNLTKLRCLILDYIDGFHAVPPDVISCLSNLQMFSKQGISHEEYEEVQVLGELEGLQYLSELSIWLSSPPAVKKFLTSEKLQKCLRMLQVGHVQGFQELELPLSTLQRLRSLCFKDIHDLENVKITSTGNDHRHHRGKRIRVFCGSHSLSSSNWTFRNLVQVVISGCHRMLELSWLIYAPCLEVLTVKDSDEMGEIIASDEGEECSPRTGGEIEEQSCFSVFSRLEELRLVGLQNLRSIYRGTLPFPSLKVMVVVGCPNLMKLPFDSSSATNTLKSIEGESMWWEELEWEDDNLKHIFSPYFLTHDY